MPYRFVGKLGLIILLLGSASLALGAKGCGWAQEEDPTNDLISGSSSDKNISDLNHALANTSWPMFLANTQHTGCSPFSGPVTNTLKWTYTIGNALNSDVAIGREGTIYVGDAAGNKLYAINSNGALRWAYPSGSVAAPAIGADDTIYFGSSSENKIYALNPDGTLKWYYPTRSTTISSPTIAPDGTIYIGCGDLLYALNSQGTLKWSHNLGSDVYMSSPAIGWDGTIYIGGGDSKFRAINPDGTLQWIYKMTAYNFEHSPAVGTDGTIYIANENGYLYAFNPDGTVKWLRSTNGPKVSSPAIGPDGTIYIGGWNTVLYAVNPNGSLKWGGYYIRGTIGSAVAIDANGIIYLGCDDNNIYALNPDGTLRWSYPTGNDIWSAPAIGADGTLYITSADGKLYAIGERKSIIKADEPSIIDTPEDEAQPDCEVSVPAEAVMTDTEVSLAPIDQIEDLPAPLPEGYVFLGGANLRPARSGKVNFAPGKEADAYVILPPSVKAEELSNADIRLMEFIDGRWVIVLPHKKGKVITTGPKAGYIGPDESAPARLTGVRPWCWVVVPPPADTTLPTTPTGLVATAISSSQINLTWDASTDDVGVIAYKVYRYNPQTTNYELRTTVTTTAYSDTGLSAGTSYSYTIVAYDAAGNTSDQSLPASVTTLADSKEEALTTISTVNIPLGWWLHTAVWTGTEVIIWGGRGWFNGNFIALNTGGRYNLQFDTWTPVSTINAPIGREGHTAIWTGSEMIIWGGQDAHGCPRDGARYNPKNDTWSTMSLAPISGRFYHTAVWTGREMIIWGGGLDNYDNTSAKYNPATDTWTPVTTLDAPTARQMHTAVWTGSEMLIWGGWQAGPGPVNTGAKYNPATDTWTPITTIGAPSARAEHTAIWTGTKMIIWGGSYLNNGGVYDPTTNTWTPISVTNVPSGRSNHTAVWTGTEMIIWGGGDSGSLAGTNARYRLSTNTWSSTIMNVLSARAHHTAIWTGSKMIIWGGAGGRDTGGIYTPPE